MDSRNNVFAGAIVNHNELMLPMNAKASAAKHGIKEGVIFYSETLESWAIQGQNDLIPIDAPIVKGQIMEGIEGKASRFNGKEIKNVVIRADMWCAVF